MSFAEVREYQSGDDVRDIDWNVTARTNRPHIKIYEEERELTVMLLIDVSGSLVLVRGRVLSATWSRRLLRHWLSPLRKITTRWEPSFSLIKWNTLFLPRKGVSTYFILSENS